MIICATAVAAAVASTFSLNFVRFVREKYEIVDLNSIEDVLERIVKREAELFVDLICSAMCERKKKEIE